ncbi:dihydrodipicolinate synthase family protein [Streptomyces sp. NPDC007172]|uniref:dihydrodipicolinate synthase family protein n=1 Tax=Streptomyces sp. NPDC007172 TaxID=3364776 RepID=UPI0036BC0DA4
MTVPLVTPVTDDGEVDGASVVRLVASLRPGVDALLPALSTGEGGLLTDRQWRTVVAAVVACADGLPVLAGILRPTTDEVVDRARSAEVLGAEAVVATTPYGTRVSQDDMYRHYERIAGATGLPVVVYHECAVSQNVMGLDTLLRICRIPGVAGVKDSTGVRGSTQELIAARPGVPVAQGLEHLLLDAGPVDGCVLALANVEPALCAALFADPGEQGAAALKEACEKYGLDRDDWFRALKTELTQRGVLRSDREVLRMAGQVPRPDRGIPS